MNTNYNLSYKMSTVTEHTHNALHGGGGIVHEDLDHKSVGSTNKGEEEALLHSLAGSNGATSDSKNRPRMKSDKEKLKVKARYKAAVKICDRFGSKSNLPTQEEERLAWAREGPKNGQVFYAAKPKFAASNPKFAKRIEEKLVIKRQRSADARPQCHRKSRRISTRWLSRKTETLKDLRCRKQRQRPVKSPRNIS